MKLNYILLYILSGKTAFYDIQCKVKVTLIYLEIFFAY